MAEQEKAKGKAPAKPHKQHSKPKPGGNGVVPEGQGTFQAQLLNNNVPMDLPSGSSWNWAIDDPMISFSQDFVTDPSGGTIIVVVPAGDTAQQFTITVDTTDPNGNDLTQTLVVPITPGVSVFSISLTQIA